MASTRCGIDGSAAVRIVFCGLEGRNECAIGVGIEIDGSLEFFAQGRKPRDGFAQWRFVLQVSFLAARHSRDHGCQSGGHCTRRGRSRCLPRELPSALRVVRRRAPLRRAFRRPPSCRPSRRRDGFRGSATNRKFSTCRNHSAASSSDFLGMSPTISLESGITP